ncbi:MAG TPA: hypothetical protein VMZ00_09080 [Sporichthya sp.]|nr:hypothetical protein [Sporichthya sp.]
MTAPATAAPTTGAAAPPRVLGIDPSLVATGIADHTGTDRIRSGDLTGTQRLDWIRDKILDQLNGIHLAVIEGPSYGSMSGSGHHEAAGLWWHITCALAEHRVPYAVVPPSTLKKYATGSGKATKPDMRVALLQRTGIDERDDNKVDAFWLRAAGLDQLGHPIVDLPKSHRDALAKVAWPQAVTS